MKDLALLKIFLLGSLIVVGTASAQDKEEDVEVKPPHLDVTVVTEQQEVIKDAQKKAESMEQELDTIIKLLEQKKATEDPQ